MDLSLKDLEEAVSIRRRIDQLQAKLNQVVGKIGGAGDKRGRRRKLSPAARAKIAAAARARWAKQRKTGAGKSKAKRGGITAAGRRKLSQLMKARWAARRKRAGKKS
jgi:hypothetical protein